MRIHNIQSRISGNEKIISGFLDDFELWYRLPKDYGIEESADPFLAAGLMIAMKKGEQISVDDKWPVSFKLLQGLNVLQDIYSIWFDDLSTVSIKSRTISATTRQQGYATFFSGGVDSLFTFYRRLPVLSHAIFLCGIDMQLDNKTLYEEVLLKNQEFCDRHGITLISMSTNLRHLCHPQGLGWGSRYSAAGLASIALLLGFPYTLVPASQSYTSMYAEGTSPSTDHLFSNEATTIYYDGGMTRTNKLKYLSQHPDAMKLLRVCWQDNGYNCGQCEKCLRTMLTCKILDIDCPTLPALDDLKVLKNWRIESDAQKNIFKNILLSVDKQRQRKIYLYLRNIQRRERFKRWLVAIDRNSFGGRLKKIFKRLCRS